MTSEFPNFYIFFPFITESINPNSKDYKKFSIDEEILFTFDTFHKAKGRVYLSEDSV